jgi:hypothetical protein
MSLYIHVNTDNFEIYGRYAPNYMQYIKTVQYKMFNICMCLCGDSDEDIGCPEI